MSRLLGLFPHKGLPSGSLALDETNVQVPTSCSFSDFCCARAGSANPSQIAVVKTIMSAVRRFMVPPFMTPNVSLGPVGGAARCNGRASVLRRVFLQELQHRDLVAPEGSGGVFAARPIGQGGGGERGGESLQVGAHEAG